MYSRDRPGCQYLLLSCRLFGVSALGFGLINDDVLKTVTHANKPLGALPASIRMSQNGLSLDWVRGAQVGESAFERFG